MGLHFQDRIELKKGLFERENYLRSFRTLEAPNERPVNVCQLIFIPLIVCVWPYPTVPNIRHSCIRLGVTVVQKVFGVNYA